MTEPKNSKSPWRRLPLPPARNTGEEEIAERRRQQRTINLDPRIREEKSRRHERRLAGALFR